MAHEVAEEMERGNKKNRQEEARRKLMQQFSAQQQQFAMSLEGQALDDELDDPEPQDELDQGTLLYYYLLNSFS